MQQIHLLNKPRNRCFSPGRHQGVPQLLVEAMAEDTATRVDEGTKHSVFIVGDGVFGASTALHLSRNYPSYNVTLFDRTPYPCPRAASYDINKIIRVGYSNIDLCRLAGTAHDVWRTDPLFNKFFHESGMLSICPYGGGVRTVINNFKLLGIKNKTEILRPEDVRRRFDGLFKDANFDHVEEFLWEPDTGWAEAAGALTATIQAAIDNRVKYIPTGISRLLVDSGCCNGVELMGGSKYHAEKILLYAGADTARLLADSAPDNSALHAGARFVAGAICVANVRSTPDQLEKFKHAPAVLYYGTPTQPEASPPDIPASF